MNDTTTGQGPGPSPPPSPLPRLRFGLFLAGLPALAAAGAMAAALAAGPAGRSLAAAYEREAVRRVKRDDFAGALVCYKRLLALTPARPEVRFATALALGRLGRGDEAEAVARTVAPRNRGGYPQAHLWLADRLLAGPGRDPARAREAEGHLLRYLQANPHSANAEAMLGTLYAMTGRAREARPYLQASAGARPDRLLILASVCRALGDRGEADYRGRAALAEARRLAEAGPDEKAARLSWAEAFAFLDDYPGAIRVLKAGEALTGDPVFRQRSDGVAAAWAAALGRQEGKAAERLSVLQLGLTFDDADPRLLAQLGSLMATGRGGEAEQARAALRAALGGGRAPVLAHFLLGSDAWSRGRTREARNHWEQAYRLDPKTPLFANNLAWTLAYQEPADLPRALALIEQALAQSPDDPRLRGTRGEIFAKMGRWKDAVPEIEAALAAGAGTPALHAALASSYDHLGMPEMAAEHRKP